jgi:hypothetical protein
VFAAQVLHHVDDLEHLFDQVAASLRDHGLFVVNEYVGPARSKSGSTERRPKT